MLLITSRDTKRLIVPKGWPMKGHKDYRAAAIEAQEEAGLIGRVAKKPIGHYTYWKRRPERFDLCRVKVYILEVERQLPAWREKGPAPRSLVPGRRCRRPRRRCRARADPARAVGRVAAEGRQAARRETRGTCPQRVMPRGGGGSMRFRANGGLPSGAGRACRRGGGDVRPRRCRSAGRALGTPWTARSGRGRNAVIPWSGSRHALRRKAASSGSASMAGSPQSQERYHPRVKRRSQGRMVAGEGLEPPTRGL